jgi:hypothetical protein
MYTRKKAKWHKTTVEIWTRLGRGASRVVKVGMMQCDAKAVSDIGAAPWDDNFGTSESWIVPPRLGFKAL